uniref:YbaP n=1 Tax=Bacillus subtilis TaxID=1423 RepID=Q9KX91_BACIU|nr:YbaP [Bacillus subtilis] [Bacillus subtilis subsp. subtilis str. 168]
MAGMFAIILLSPINFIMEKQNKRQACCSLPMDWRLYPANRSRMESG